MAGTSCTGFACSLIALFNLLWADGFTGALIVSCEDYFMQALCREMVFADMEELGVRPNNFIVEMLGNVFQELGMMDKYEKLKKKYPPAKWEYRYFKGKRVRVRSKQPNGTPLEGNGTNLSNQASEVDEQPYSSLNQNEVGEEAYDNSLSTLSELDDRDHKMNSLNQLGEIDEGDYQTNSLNQPTEVDEEDNIDEEDYRTNSLNQLNEVDEEANAYSIN